MKLHFCKDDDVYKPNKVLCIEYDGEISCFELGVLPPPPDDPKELGIVFPCCVRKKEKSSSKKEATLVKVRKPAMKNKNVCNLKQVKSSNIKRVASEECQLLPKSKKPNQDCILYVFDKNGFNKVISYAKANVQCKDSTAELKLGKSRDQDKKSSNNRKKLMFSASLNVEKSLRTCKSRELRGGILSTDCFCLRRNGLQYDCRRTGCQNSPLCSVLPAPVCEPSRVACVTHCSNPHAEELSSICKLRPW